MARNDIITFPDRNLEAALRRRLRKPKGDFHLSDFDGIKTLWLDGNQIVDPSGLAALTGLQTLGLDGNQIVDPSGLAALRKRGVRIYGIGR